MPHRASLVLIPLPLLASCWSRPSADPSEETRSIKQQLHVQPPQGGTVAQIAEYVVAAFEDSRGVLWFGTMNKGVARYDGKALTYLTEADGLCGNTIASIAEDKHGAMWFGGHTGVCKYDGMLFTSVLDGEGSVRTDRGGTAWVSANNRVYRDDGAGLHPFSVPIPGERPAAYSIVPGRVTFRLEDRQGNLWFSTDGYGAFRYSRPMNSGASGGSFTQFTKKDGLCSNTVWSILEDRQGRIWFTCIQAFQPQMTGDGGLCRYDGKSFATFPEVAGLTKNDIYTIYEDRSGSIWIGATHVGAYRYDGSEFALFSNTDRSDLTESFGLQAILEDRNGKLWCGFSGGLFRFNGSSVVNVAQSGPWD
jgi:ligand-binding sensor domain-containing protein